MDDESSIYDKLESMLQDRSSEPSYLPLEHLRKVTNNFSDKRLLGQGGFGKVYKGVLQNGEMVAVKKLDQLKPGVQERQFENEVYHLMRLKHPNIVRFLGYCYETQNELIKHNGKYVFAEKQQRLLCLEYLPNGSLDKHLSDASSGLDWCTRYKIIKGICCGLHYLHEECQCENNAFIIHLDLKPANILLDDNMVPKVADFGLSKLFDDKKTQTCATTFFGSFGYMAPEYMYGRIITTKADIYGLGVIIIEIITGPGSINPFNFNIVTACQDFIETVLKNWTNRPEAALSATDCHQIKSCLEIGISCIKFDRDERPATREIVERLNRLESTNINVNNEQKPSADQIMSEPKELVDITPLELCFFLELNKRIPCLVKLTNKTDECVAFYFGVARATNNYYIEPTSGIMWPQSTFNIVVTMEELQELPLDLQCNDEFLVQSIIVGTYMLTSKPILDMFNNMSSNMVHKVKLTVVCVRPPQPLSIPRVWSEESSSPLPSSSGSGNINHPRETKTSDRQVFDVFLENVKYSDATSVKYNLNSKAATLSQEQNIIRSIENILNKFTSKRVQYVVKTTPKRRRLLNGRMHSKKSQSSMYKRKISTENREANFSQTDRASNIGQENVDNLAFPVAVRHNVSITASSITETAAGILQPESSSSCVMDCEHVDFIREILNTSFPKGGSICSLLERSNDSDILDPCLLEELNGNIRLALGEEEGKAFKVNRRLLFDRVNELLSAKCAYYFNAGYGKWLFGMVVLQKLSPEDVYREMTCLKAVEEWMVDQLVSRDMSSTIGSWLDFMMESHETGRDISTSLLGDLVDEMIYDLLTDYTTRGGARLAQRLRPFNRPDYLAGLDY